MNHIAIHGRRIRQDSVSQISLLLENLRFRGVGLIISRTFFNNNQDQFLLNDFKVYPDSFKGIEVEAVLSVGGDGTLLETVTHIGRQEFPILGINTGRLGFLATTGKEDIVEAMDLLFAGKYSLEKRSLVCLDVMDNPFGDLNFSLNEFAILRRDTSSMITVKCFLNGAYLNTYRADGLMVSTPTGSTGYSLSCGGPILLPTTENFVITPVSPHNLNTRPLVVPDSGELTFQIESRESKLLISLDSRSAAVAHEMEIKVKKADFYAKLICLEGYDFLETLRNKLGWGFDKRN